MSSIPDDWLIDLAAAASKPTVFDQQVRRMGRGSEGGRRAVHDFAAQWLNLRRLSEVVVIGLLSELRRKPAEWLREETDFFVGVLREDRSVLDLLRADYGPVNERVARHYGIPAIYGSRFRR
jgi:hypothetical protein